MDSQTSGQDLTTAQAPPSAGSSTSAAASGELPSSSAPDAISSASGPRRVRALFGLHATTPDDVFEGWHDPDSEWNGFMKPVFSRRTTERIVAWWTADECCDPTATFRWDGDVLLMIESDGDRECVQRFEPDADGRYGLGAESWMWEEIEVPAGESLKGYLQRRGEDSMVYLRASNHVIKAALDLGITGREASRAAGSAGDRAVRLLAVLRPVDPDEELPPGSIEYLGLSVVTPIAGGKSRHVVVAWSDLDEGQRQRLLDLAVTHAVRRQSSVF